MSEEEVVVQEASKISNKDRDKIHLYFENNAAYFSQHGKHHTKYITKLFHAYNENFSMESFKDSEIECEECRDTIIKFWSFILFDIWEREII
jgi:hypothetical protein